jgi:chromate transporter
MKPRQRRSGAFRIILKPRVLIRQSRLRVWLRLLWMFLKVNILSPSGPASLGLLYDEAVGKIMSEEQFVEAVGFSNVLPGSEALKLAMFVGYAAGGLAGVFTALLGAILPPTILMFTVAALLRDFQDAAWLKGFVGGMSPAVAALILLVAWQISLTSRTRRTGARALLIAAVSAAGFLAGMPIPLVLLGAGLLGVVLFR